MNSEDSFPTLYLDSSYSRHLNREGLYIAAEAVERKAAPAPASVGKRRARDVGSTTKELAAAAVYTSCRKEALPGLPGRASLCADLGKETKDVGCPAAPVGQRTPKHYSITGPG